MYDKRWRQLVTGLMLLAAGTGCQTFRGDSAKTASGPSRSFGMEYVPRQSEPPLETADASVTTGSKPPAAKTSISPEAADDNAPKRANALIGFMERRTKEPPSKPFPVSSRSASASESTADGTDGSTPDVQ